MEPIAKSLSTYKPESSQTLARPLSIKNVQYVFDSMKGQLGAKVADMWQGVDPSIIEREWSAGLAGFQRSELERGLMACRDRKFAPTLGEFTNLCRPALDPEYAWHEALDGLRERDGGESGEWTHPAVFFAAINMSVAVRGGEYPKHRTAWARVLKREIANGWREIPKPAMRVERNERIGPPPKHIAELLAQQNHEIRKAIERRAFDDVLKQQGE